MGITDTCLTFGVTYDWLTTMPAGKLLLVAISNIFDFLLSSLGLLPGTEILEPLWTQKG